MPELTATEAAAQENRRVMGIIGCSEAKGREALAQMLAGQPGMSVAQAQGILAAAAPQQEVVSEADRIMALDDAKGREGLASTLAAMSDMTTERAKTILAAAPRAGTTSLSDSILALDEAKGREELAGKLATIPGMTVEQARELLAAAPDASGSGGTNMNNAFDQFMQLHSPASLSGSSGNSSDVDTDTQLLMSIPGTMAAEGEDKS